MTSGSQPNRFFKPQRESDLADDEVRGSIRAEFYDVRSRFLNRLACAQVFDHELFEAILLWLETLQRSCAAADLQMASSDFDEFSSIASYLEQEATFSKNQRAECAAALKQWTGIMAKFGVAKN